MSMRKLLESIDDLTEESLELDTELEDELFIKMADLYANWRHADGTGSPEVTDRNFKKTIENMVYRIIDNYYEE